MDEVDELLSSMTAATLMRRWALSLIWRAQDEYELGEVFTIRELRWTVARFNPEAAAMPDSFRRAVLRVLVPTGDVRTAVRGKPAALYQVAGPWASED